MENTSKKSSSDEIELSGFFRQIGKGFTNFGNGIINFLATLRILFFKNKPFFFLIITAGLILGGVYHFLQKPVYKSTLILRCEYMTHDILEKNIETLNLLADEEDPKGLAEVLKLKPAIAANIAKIEFEPFVSKEELIETEVLKEQLRTSSVETGVANPLLSKIEIQNHKVFEISVYVYTPNTFKQAENAMVNYFKNSEFIKRRIQNTKTTLTARRRKLQMESKKLDSLKGAIFTNYQNLGKLSRGSGNIILGDEGLTDPLAVYKQDLELNHQIIEIDERLYLQPDFEVLKGFTTFRTPDSFGLPLILFVSFWMALLSGYLFIGAAKLDKMLARRSAVQELIHEVA